MSRGLHADLDLGPGHSLTLSGRAGGVAGGAEGSLRCLWRPPMGWAGKGFAAKAQRAQPLLQASSPDPACVRGRRTLGKGAWELRLVGGVGNGTPGAHPPRALRVPTWDTALDWRDPPLHQGAVLGVWLHPQGTRANVPQVPLWTRPGQAAEARPAWGLGRDDGLGGGWGETDFRLQGQRRDSPTRSHTQPEAASLILGTCAWDPP